MNLRQINFKQPKYIFTAIVAIPIGALIYFVTNMFTTSTGEDVATDHINMNLPEAKVESEYDKLKSMESRYEKGDSYSAVDGFGMDKDEKERLDSDEYSEEELQ